MALIDRRFVVDLLDLAEELPATGFRGRLGMCRLPGYEFAELTTDIDALAALAPSTVVSLLQRDELLFLLGMNEPGTGFFARMGNRGFVHRHFPIRNGGVPDGMYKFAALIDALCDELAAGRTIVLHCVAGHGRTGLVAAACLVRLGVAPEDAVAAVRRRRPGTIETAAQEAFVGEYARAIGLRGLPDDA